MGRPLAWILSILLGRGVGGVQTSLPDDAPRWRKRIELGFSLYIIFVVVFGLITVPQRWGWDAFKDSLFNHFLGWRAIAIYVVVLVAALAYGIARGSRRGS